MALGKKADGIAMKVQCRLILGQRWAARVGAHAIPTSSLRYAAALAVTPHAIELGAASAEMCIPTRVRPSLL